MSNGHDEKRRLRGMYNPCTCCRMLKRNKLSVESCNWSPLRIFLSNCILQNYNPIKLQAKSSTDSHSIQVFPSQNPVTLLGVSELYPAVRSCWGAELMALTKHLFSSCSFMFFVCLFCPCCFHSVKKSVSYFSSEAGKMVSLRPLNWFSSFYSRNRPGKHMQLLGWISADELDQQVCFLWYP